MQKDIYQRQEKAFGEIKSYLSAGEQTPSNNAAEVILGLCQC